MPLRVQNKYYTNQCMNDHQKTYVRVIVCLCFVLVRVDGWSGWWWWWWCSWWASVWYLVAEKHEHRHTAVATRTSYNKHHTSCGSTCMTMETRQTAIYALKLLVNNGLCDVKQITCASGDVVDVVVGDVCRVEALSPLTMSASTCENSPSR